MAEWEDVSPARFRLNKMGWLTKLGGFIKNWKRRWFILDAEAKVLIYQESDNDSRALGTIELDGARLIDSKDCLVETGKDFCFGIVTGKRTYYMYAEDAPTCREWMRVLRVVIRQGSQASESEPTSAPAAVKEAPQANTFGVHHQSVPSTSLLPMAEKSSADLFSSQGHSRNPSVLGNPVASATPMSAASTAKSSSAGAPRPRTATPPLIVTEQPMGEVVSHTLDYKRLRNRTSRAEFNEQERMITRVSKLVDAKSKDVVVAPPQNGSDVPKCPNCSVSFGLLQRRSNCRLCGKVYCTKPECLQQVSVQEMSALLRLKAVADDRDKKKDDFIPVCPPCVDIINQAGLQAQLRSTEKSDTSRLFEQLKTIQDQIDDKLANLQQVVTRYRRTPAAYLLDDIKSNHVALVSMIEKAAHISTKIASTPGGKQRERMNENVKAAAAQWNRSRLFAVKNLLDEIALK